MEARVIVSGHLDARIVPGDAIDYGGDAGVLVWLALEDAQAWRLTQAKRRRETQRAIVFGSTNRPPA